MTDPDREPRPTQVQTRFVFASRKAAGRRQRALFAGTAVALVVALVLGSVAFIQRQEAARQRAEAIDQRDLARSGDLAASALTALQSDEELGLLLSLEAARMHRTDLVKSALRDALNASDVQLVFDAHDNKVGDVVFGPGGDTIASGGADFKILIWDTDSGSILQTIQAEQPLTMLAFDPKGRWIASGTPDDGVVLWDPTDGELVRRLPFPGVAFEVRLSPHGDMLIAGGDEATRVWRTSTLEPVLTIPPGPAVTYGAHVTDSGDRVVTANANGTVKMFDGHSGNLVRTLGTHDDLAFTVELNARGERVLSGGEDRTVRVWDAASGEQLNVLPHDTLISDASWVGMDYIASLESDGVGLVWDFSSGAVVNELRGHTGYSSALAVSSDGDRIATGSDDGTVGIWRPGEGVGHVTIHRNGFVWAAEYSSDESGILTAGLTGLVERWDARTGTRRRVIFDGEGKTTVLDVSVADRITAVAFRREERGLVVSGGVVFVDPDRGIEHSRYTIDGRAYPITVAMDATGRRAVGLWSDGVARVVDAEGDLVSEYEVEPPPIRLDDSLAELSPTARARRSSTGGRTRWSIRDPGSWSRRFQPNGSTYGRSDVGRRESCGGRAR